MTGLILSNLYDNQTLLRKLYPNLWPTPEGSVLAEGLHRNKYKPMNWPIQVGCLLMAYSLLEIERAGKNLEFFR
jgi:hypothetical protein